MNTYKNIYTRQIYDLIAPLVGDLMSKGALRAQCKRLNIDEESIARENLKEISSGIKLGLTLFLGTEGANSIADRIAKM